jgi:hypothetical protein
MQIVRTLSLVLVLVAGPLWSAQGLAMTRIDPERAEQLREFAEAYREQNGGSSYGQAVSVPEPNTLVLVGLGAVALVAARTLRRRRQ